MEAIMEVLEQELEAAFEVKDKKSLHRYILLLTENVVKKESYERQQLEMRSDIRNLAELIKLGFQRMDERFEAMQLQMDKRFESVDRRFETVDKRFEVIDKRFEAVDKRFEEINVRLENLSVKMFHFMIWSFGFTATMAGIVIGVIKFM